MKELVEIISKVSEILYELDGSAGVSRVGMYDVPKDFFEFATLKYMESDDNYFQVYDKVKHLSWSCHDFDYEAMDCDIQFWEELDDNHAVLEWFYSKEIKDIDSYIERSKKQKEFRESYAFRRKESQRVISNRKLRTQVFGRDGYACLHCGATENLSIDHVKPVSAGGGDELDNLQTLCRSCNSSKGAST